MKFRNFALLGTLVIIGVLCLLYHINKNAIKEKELKKTEEQNEQWKGTRLDKISVHDGGLLEQMDALVTRGVTADDEELVRLARKMMDPPSYTFSHRLSRAILKTPQAAFIDEYLQGKKGGFFIEAGAFDGERSSNTLFFETSMGWTGLLVEADPFFYAQLLGKNRRAWSINACLSTSNMPSRLAFTGHNGGQGKVKPEEKKEKISMTSTRDLVVPCFPLHTLLLAIHVTHVDFFSLDVEGVELSILNSTPFHLLNIKTLAVEYAHINKSECQRLMQQKGYKVEKDIQQVDYSKDIYAQDFIFVKKDII